MTREQWKKLSHEDKWIKVAELCGWRFIGQKQINATIRMEAKDGYVYCIPDYLGDLNAMHKAEKLIPNMSEHIHGSLSLVVVGMRTGGAQPMGDSCVELVTATAAQRAEAFVLTMESE